VRSTPRSRISVTFASKAAKALRIPTGEGVEGVFRRLWRVTLWSASRAPVSIGGRNPASKSLAKNADRTEFHSSRKLIAAAGAGALGLFAHGSNHPSVATSARSNTMLAPSGARSASTWPRSSQGLAISQLFGCGFAALGSIQALAAEWPGFARPFCCFFERKIIEHMSLHPFFETGAEEPVSLQLGAQITVLKSFAVSPPTWRRYPQCLNELREGARNIQ
jgi:hypothetical protein